MSVFTNTTEVAIREQRLGTITSYEGDLDEIIEKSKTKSLCSGCASYEQCGNCGQENAVTITVWIQGSAVITHAPIGCGAPGIEYAASVRGSAQGQQRHVWQLTTNIQEKDTIYGAAAKLHASIREAKERFDPKVIFILTSCVSGIIGEDIESVADEEEEVLGIPIVPIYCEGFKSSHWATGFDAAYHGILRKLIHEPEKKQKDLVNIFNFLGADRLEGLLARAGLRANFLVPFVSVEELQTMAEAACSATFCESLSTYIAGSLADRFGVPVLESPPPFGVKWTDNWFQEIGALTGHQEEVERVIAEEHEKIKDELEELRGKLKGKKVYIISGDTFAFQLANVARDLGMEIAGVTQLHHDQVLDGKDGCGSLKQYREEHGNIDDLHICAKQPYQVLKLVRESGADFLFCRHTGIASFGMKLGIPALVEGNRDFSIAYEGVLNLGRRCVIADQTRGLIANIREHAKLPYKESWMNA